MSKLYFTEIKGSTLIWRACPEMYLPEWKGHGRQLTRLQVRKIADDPIRVDALVGLIPQICVTKTEKVEFLSYLF